MRFTPVLTLTTALLGTVSALAVPRPWIVERNLAPRDASAEASTEDKLRVFMRDFNPWKAENEDWIKRLPPGVEYIRPRPGKQHRPAPWAKQHSHDESLVPGPGTPSQEEIDAVANASSFEDAVARLHDLGDDFDSDASDSELNSAPPTQRSAGLSADANKHRIHSHDEYLEDSGRPHKVHSHDEYLPRPGEFESASTPQSAKHDKVQKRCVWKQNCGDICNGPSIVGWIGCAWNCGGDAAMPTCSESVGPGA